MSRRLSASLLSAVVALSPIPLIVATTPAAAQVNVNFNIGFDYFYDELSPYGDWFYHPRWGDVWQPTRVGGDFRPYFRGYWVDTEYGLTWESPDPWGDVAYHYGRWVYDPYDGWLWVPGYTWAPAWVVWRQGGGNIGWFPMPPDDQFLAGYDVYRDDWDWDRGHFGYADWYGPSVATGLLAAWTFVALDRLADRDYYRYAYPRPQVVNIINNTRNVTNYVTVNNRIVNRSINVDQIERESGRRIQRVEARNVVRTPITTVETGRQVQVRERERHGGDARAPARERVRQLSREEVRTPVRERRAAARFDRDQQQAQPNVQQQPAERDQRAIERRGADQRGAAIREREERAQALQRDREEAQRAQAEQRQRNAIEQREQQQQERVERQRDLDDRAAVRAQEEQQNRARAEQAETRRLQAEQQQRARAEQAERAQREQIERQRRSDIEQQQNRGRAEQAERAQREQIERQRRSDIEQQQNRAQAAQAERMQRAQAEQEQNRARAAQVERMQRAQVDQQQARVRAEQQADQQAQRQAAAEQRRAKQQQNEEERAARRQRN